MYKKLITDMIAAGIDMSASSEESLHYLDAQKVRDFLHFGGHSATIAEYDGAATPVAQEVKVEEDESKEDESKEDAGEEVKAEEDAGEEDESEMDGA